MFVIESSRAEREYISFWADFYFLQHRAYFGGLTCLTDLFFVNLRFVFERLPFQIGLAFRTRAIMKLLAQSPRPI